MEPIEEITLMDDRYSYYIDRYHKSADPQSVNNTNDKLKLPDQFFKVLKKSIIDLDMVTIDSYSVYNVYNPANFDAIPKYLVELTLHFNWDVNLQGKNTKEFTEIINSAFSLMYMDKINVSFNVSKLKIPKRDYEREFFEFFTQ